MSNDSFFEVPLNSYDSSACSPELPDEPGFALALAAPARLDRRQRDTFPLCGTLRMGARTMVALGADPIEQTVVVVTPEAGGPATAFNLTPDKAPVDDEAAPARDPDDFSDTQLRTNWFNVDLLTFSPELPERLRPGRYVIYATCGHIRSNALTVEVTSPPPP